MADKNDTTVPLEQRIEAGCRTVICRTCKAGLGEPCHTPDGRERPAHLPRFNLASACNAIPVV